MELNEISVPLADGPEVTLAVLTGDFGALHRLDHHFVFNIITKITMEPFLKLNPKLGTRECRLFLLLRSKTAIKFLSNVAEI